MAKLALRYRRILLKLSGEMLAGKKDFGLDAVTLDTIVKEVAEVHKLGVQIGLVIGAGNIFRGANADELGLDRANGDYMGMLGTVINALALQNALEHHGVESRVMSAIEVRQVAEPYIRGRARRHLEKGRVVIFAGGTGNPYFTTDTAASLRAMEIDAEILLKGTKVDGIYREDPVKNPKAKRYKEISYIEVLQKRIKVMDAAAISLCLENHLPIEVFNLAQEGNLRKIVSGQRVGTYVS